MVQDWIKEVKDRVPNEQLGMILVHNGIVRGTDKSGKPVKGMELTYDESKLQNTITKFKQNEGITDIKVWINKGRLNIGDDIMFALVAGRYRTDVLPVFQELLKEIKSNIVREMEF